MLCIRGRSKLILCALERIKPRFCKTEARTSPEIGQSQAQPTGQASAHPAQPITYTGVFGRFSQVRGAWASPESLPSAARHRHHHHQHTPASCVSRFSRPYQVFRLIFRHVGPPANLVITVCHGSPRGSLPGTSFRWQRT